MAGKTPTGKQNQNGGKDKGGSGQAKRPGGHPLSPRPPKPPTQPPAKP